MFRLLLLVILALLGLWAYRQLLPDIQRYMALRSM